MIGQLLPQPGHVLSITRQAVERLAHHHVRFAILDQAQQLFEAGAIALVARHFRIMEGRDHCAIEIIDQLHAGRRLVLA